MLLVARVRADRLDPPAAAARPFSHAFTLPFPHFCPALSHAGQLTTVPFGRPPLFIYDKMTGISTKYAVILIRVNSIGFVDSSDTHIRVS